MKYYDYSGILSNDIKTSKKKFDFKFFLSCSIINIISIIAVILLFTSFSHPVWFTTLITSLDFIIVEPLFIFKSIQRAKNKANIATNNITKLYEQINKEKNIDKNISEKIMQNCIIESNEPEVQNNDKITDEKLIYLLDKKEQLQILKETITKLVYWDKEFIDYRLALLDDEDIKSEQINVEKVMQLGKK